MYKNVASQKVAIFAWDGSAGVAKTGDAANITAEISLDGGVSAPTNDLNPTELDATDHPGVYIFDLTQAETNADLIVITPVSSTADIIIRPIIVTPTLLTSTKAGYLDASIQTVDTVVDAIKAVTDNLPNSGALNDLAAILVDTGTTLPATLNTIIGYLDTEIAAILADTNELQGDWANGGRLDLLLDAVKAVTDLLPNAGALTDIDTGVNNIEAKLPTNFIMGSSVQTDKDDEVDAIKAKTDNLPTDPADQSLVEAAITALNDPTVGEIADAVWDEAIAGHIGAGTFGAKNQKVVPSESAADYKADVSALALEANVQTHAAAALTAYDPPTRAEATSDKNEIITQVNANETKIDVIDGIVDAILLDTNELQADWTDGGRLDLLLDAIKAKTDNLEDSWNDITVADILAGVIEGTYDIQDCFKIILAYMASKASGGGTSTVIFRDTADSKDRITLTVDANGNRSAAVINVT